MKNYTISESTLTIYDSYKIPKSKFRAKLNSIKALHPSSNVWKRSWFSLKKEWATHNALYALHYKRDHTKDVDMEYPMSLYNRIRFAVFGCIVWPFIK